MIIKFLLGRKWKKKKDNFRWSDEWQFLKAADVLLTQYEIIFLIQDVTGTNYNFSIIPGKSCFASILWIPGYNRFHNNRIQESKSRRKLVKSVDSAPEFPP